MHMDDGDFARLDRIEFPVSSGITRSKSFTGIFSNQHYKRPSFSGVLIATSTSTGSLQSTASRTGAQWTPVLGQSHRGSSSSVRSLGMPLAKIPKIPCPARALSIFNALIRGLNECVSVTEEDISSLKRSVEGLSVNSQQSQGKRYELEKQLKVAERYLKRLEYHLAKLEELQDQYILQQKLKDGVRNMAHAYILSPGRKRESALSNVRSGFKECMESLSCAEAQLEITMGTLQFEMKGVQGFARLCSGDAFEICVRHGHQKWKSRGRVLKNKMQTWDSQGVIFKALLSEVLHIKAVEAKGLTKMVLLGNKYCDTKDLFCANPQIMTVNLNSSGSLKLSIIITWNPLDETRDDLLHSQQLSKSTGSPMLKERPSPQSLSHGSLSSQTSSPRYYDGCSSNGDGNYSPDVDSRSLSSGHSSVSAGSATLGSSVMNFSGEEFERQTLSDASLTKEKLSQVPNVRYPLKSSSLDCMHLNLNDGINHRSWNTMDMYDMNNDAKHPSIVWPLINQVHSVDSCSFGQDRSSRASRLDSASLHEIVHRLTNSLEDSHGRNPELYELDLQLVELQLLFRGDGRRGSHSSDMSTSIESALECFDFLNTEVDEDDHIFTDKKVGDAEKYLDPELTITTFDSGIASIARKLRCCNSNSSEFSRDSVLPITGSEQLDLAFKTHLNQCLHLLENLGKFGPLKCREAWSLCKLKVHTTVIARLLKLVKLLKEDTGCLLSGVDELKDDTPLQQLWSCATKENGSLFCVGAELCYHQFVAACQKRLQRSYPADAGHLAEKVAHLLVTRILDSRHFDGETVITVHQFSDYFWKNVSCSFEKLLEDLADEMILVEILRSSNVDGILTVLMRLSSASDLPTHDCLTAIVALVVCDNRYVQQAAIKYLLNVGNDSSLRCSVITFLKEGLESEDFVIRQASVAALACLEAKDCIDLLAYIFQADESAIVRSEAKSALLSFGLEGRQAYEQGQLSSLGFQGLHIQ